MNKKELLHIIKKYRRGKASEEERGFIEAYYNLLNLEEEAPKEKLNDAFEDKFLNKIWDRIRVEEQKTFKHPKRFVYLKRVAAAVIVLFGLGAALYGLYLQNEELQVKNNNQTVARHPTVIKPASKKAILTLANGQNLILDSGSNRISKGVIQQNGGLIYQEGAIGETRHYNTLTTPKGGEFQLVLSDGTKVWLNAASSLTYPVHFQGKYREVHLKGEAYFEVNTDKNHPFKVVARECEIQVLGTHFNVNAYPESGKVRTTLAEGSVKVIKDENEELLMPGEQAIVAKGNIGIKTANIEKVLAWKKNLFYFDQTNIKEIMKILSRWYNVEIRYDTNHLENLNFSGIISRYSNFNDILKRLELTGTIHFEVEGRRITITSKAK